MMIPIYSGIGLKEVFVTFACLKTFKKKNYEKKSFTVSVSGIGIGCMHVTFCTIKCYQPAEKF